MASIRPRGKKKLYYALFRDANGNLVQRCTKLTDKRKAQDLADEWEKMARPTAGEVSMENMRRVIADLHRKFLGSEMPSMTVRAYAAQWLATKKNETGDDTMRFYGDQMRLFLRHLGPRADLDLFRITRADIVGFRDARRQLVTGKTTNHSLKTIRMLFKQAQADGWTPENPCADVKKVKEMRSEKAPKRPYSDEEFEAVMRVSDGEWRDMMIRAYYTGQRLLDIALMTGENEDPHMGIVKFWSNKTDLRIIVDMAPPYIEWVLSKKSSDNVKAPLHPRAYAAVMKRTKNRTVTLSTQFATLLMKAGLRPKKSHHKQEDGPGRSGRRTRNALTFHSLRHTMVSDLANAGVAKSVVMDLVGHESEDVNTTYTHFDSKTKKAAVAHMRDVTKFGARSS
ncbi:tyrosine-type recombinase/integrase [Prosthecobacter sp.]|uniref:tyrosine-type recombinase/integrase n=1 Tax=Prosthecobacter sp. TaxID=1965333 RepID=UPI0037851B25